MSEEKIPVLVTGAAGFTGQHQVKYLLSCTDPKYEVIGTDLKKPTDPHYPPIPFLEKDITKSDDLYAKDFQEILEPAKVIFHPAGLFNYSAPPQKLLQVNVLGTQNLFNAILRSRRPVLESSPKEANPRVIVWGAAGIFGHFDHLARLPATEDMLPKTDNPYLLSKWLQEREALNYWEDHGIPVTVIRPSAIYGPGSNYGMALSILLIGRGILPPMTVGNGKNHAGLVHVEDVVRAAEFLSRHSKAVGEVFQVTDDGNYTIENITRCIAHGFGLPFISWLKIPPFVLHKIVDWANKKSKKLGVNTALDHQLVDLITTNSWISNEKLKSFGYEFKYPDSLDGLRQTIAWYKEEKWV